MINPSSLSPTLWLDAGSGVTVGGARSLNGTNQYFGTSINSSLQAGNVDFWMSAWVKPSNLSGQWTILGQWRAGYLSYLLFFDASTRPAIIGYNGGEYPMVTSTVSAPVNQWSHIIAWHKAATHEFGLSVNGTSTTSTYTATPFVLQASGGFDIGRRDSIDTYNFPGAIGPVSIGKSPAGGLASVLSDIRDTLYAGGVGVWANQISAAKKTAWGLVSYWDANDLSGDLVDSYGSNTLTAYNTPGVADGPGTYSTLSDGDPIMAATGRNSTANWSQATASKRSSYLLSGNSKASLRFDGVDDFLQATASISQPFTAFLAMYDRGGATYFRSTAGSPDACVYRSGDVLYADAGSAISGDYTYNDSAPVVLSVRFDGGNSLVRVNSASVASGDAGANGLRTAAVLGAGAAGTTGNSLIDAQEFIVVPSSLSVAQIRGVEEYLATKYRITLTPPVTDDVANSLLLRP